MKEKFEDQFEPYVMFGCDMKSSFNGTIFRLPLRTAAQADKSDISKRVFTTDDVEKCFANFCTHANEYMLFLNNVREIEVYEWCDGASNPSLQWRIQSAVAPLPPQKHSTLRISNYEVSIRTR